MWTLEKLQQRFSMSSQQIYRRLGEAKPLLEQHTQRGDKNSIILTEGGFKILESVIELEKLGKTLPESVEEAARALGLDSNGSTLQHAAENLTENRNELKQTEYRTMVEQLGFLKGQLALKDELLKDLKTEVIQLREENILLSRKAALVEYHLPRRWWQFWRKALPA